MLNLRYNPATGRFDCYENGEHIDMLLCGTRFNFYYADENFLVAGRIGHYSTYVY